MATTPVTPAAAKPSSSTPTGLTAAAPLSVSTWVTNWETLINAHKTLLIVIILAFTAFHFYSKGIDAWDRHDSLKAQQAAATVNKDVATTNTEATQLAALQAQVAAQSSLIAKQIAQRNQAVTQQQTTDKTLPPTALAQRWQQLLGVAGITPSGAIDPVTGQSYTVTEDAATQTVEQLEEVPALTANVAALQAQLANAGVIEQKQATLITDLNADLAAEKASHAADVNAQKVKTKSAFVRGLKYGFIGGFIAGFVSGHYF